MTGPEHDLSFRCMGSDMRVLVGEPLEPGLPGPAAAAEAVRAFLVDFDRRLSRFKPDSELSALNRDPRSVVPASELLRQRCAGGALGRGAHRRARRSHARGRARAARLRELARRRPAGRGAPRRSPRRRRRVRRIPTPAAAGARSASTTRRAPWCARPACGSTAAAPARAWPPTWRPACCAGTRASSSTAAATCGSAAPARRRTRTRSRSSTRSRASACSCCGSRAAASPPPASTSGCGARAAGRFAHHLLDPATGEPAWTGLVGVTALGSTALEAETLAKAALLSGPAAARAWLADHGGVLVHDSGESEQVGLRELSPARVRFVLPAPLRAA